MRQKTLFIVIILFSFLIQTTYSQQIKEAHVKLTIPKSPWVIIITSEAPELKIKNIKPDGSQGYFMMIDEKAKLNASIFIEPVNKCKTSKECRDMIWKSGHPAWKNLQNVKQYEIDDISIVEFLLPEFQGQPVKQQNMYAQFVVDGYWVDLHISKINYQEQDHALFEQMVKSVKFESKNSDKGEKQQSQSVTDERIDNETMQLIERASAAYIKSDYKNAIKLYSKALDIEKKQPTLSKNLWRVVVDNLAMSHGISGDNKRAKEVIEYGLSKDSTYPMFYYLLACAEAEMNNLDGTIKNLKLAYTYKANIIPGERIPDPASDDSFKRFLSNPEFQKFLKEIPSK